MECSHRAIEEAITLIEWIEEKEKEKENAGGMTSIQNDRRLTYSCLWRK
jgi:hypothetical protein